MRISDWSSDVCSSDLLIYRRLIRATHAKKLPGPMSEAELERWVKAVSSHSIRVGVAQDNFAADESLPAIMQAYRWRAPRTVLRYGKKHAANSRAGARMAARFAASARKCVRESVFGLALGPN